MDYSVDAATQALNRDLFEMQEAMREESGEVSPDVSLHLARLHDIWATTVAEYADPIAALRAEIDEKLPATQHPVAPRDDSGVPHLLMTVDMLRSPGQSRVGFGL